MTKEEFRKKALDIHMKLVMTKDEKVLLELQRDLKLLRQEFAKSEVARRKGK